MRTNKFYSLTDSPDLTKAQHSQALQSEMEAYLASGGQITKCPAMTFQRKTTDWTISHENKSSWKKRVTED